ncbi:MAG: tRNA (N(6)-L-threonylcarbamoyladenosine(37)-C(2))-methylthiotransferase MtaB [Acutalibacteraceae bacterium]|nr:tRNA (N(6)-L-threonylcarbamoyladenosine(37)-C(2))-methylthiotransferase MtaB [Acutalibacteraceae bacterium]
MKVAFYTLGCKVNQYETQVMRELFEKEGYTVVSDCPDVNVFIINSCTVTAESDRKTRQMLRKYRSLYKDAVIVLTGCMPQAFPKDALKLTEADIILGNTDARKIIGYVSSFMSNGERIVDIEKHERKEKFNTPDISDFNERTRAFMKIQDGCDRYCTYCIIPTARGDIRSKNLADIKKEAEQLALKGFKEVVLVGINLTSYGKELEEDVNICDAVEAVCQVDSILRVRLGSLEPDHISDEMLNRLSKQKKFCPQFHLSLQSGCDTTLKRMNRHYDTSFYRDLVKRIRSTFKNASITTDIMVGFAGETEEEFEQSLDFAKEIGFASAHVFAYSRREGTVAAGLNNQVEKSEKSRRSKLMISATKKTEEAFLDKMLYSTVEVLFETTDEKGYYHGFTDNYCQVKVKSDKSLTGKITPVKITHRTDTCLFGKVDTHN